MQNSSQQQQQRIRINHQIRIPQIRVLDKDGIIWEFLILERLSSWRKTNL